MKRLSEIIKEVIVSNPFIVLVLHGLLCGFV